MATDPTSRLQDIDARVLIGEINEIPNVYISFITNQRQLISKSDLDVAA